MVQVLRYQTDELDALRLEQAGLDPMTRAVEVQAGVIDHRDLAAQVLRGRAESEPQRLLQQRLVDSRVAALAADLAGNLWPRARSESDALRGDWLKLVLAWNAHRIDAAGSDLAHRLLVEQSLQVIDHLGNAGIGVGTIGLRASLDPGASADAPRPMRSAELLQRFAGLKAARADQMAAQVGSLQRQRSLLSGALVLLVAAAGWLVWQLARRQTSDEAAPPSTASAGAVQIRRSRKHAAAESDAAARDTLQRMRRLAPVSGPPAPSPSTLPPQDR